MNSIKKAPTPPGVGVSIKRGEQDYDLEKTLPLFILYYQIVLSESVLKKMNMNKALLLHRSYIFPLSNVSISL